MGGPNIYTEPIPPKEEEFYEGLPGGGEDSFPESEEGSAALPAEQDGSLHDIETPHKNPTLSDIMNHAKLVFGDKEKIDVWMTEENIALGGRKPLDILLENSPEGREEVNDILGRIEYGVYS